MSSIQKFYPKFDFGGYADIYGTVIFYNKVKAIMKLTDVV